MTGVHTRMRAGKRRRPRRSRRIRRPIWPCRRASTRPYRSREQGSRDWRMLPCVVVVWTTLLAEHAAFGHICNGAVGDMTLMARWPRQAFGPIWPAAAIVLLLLIMPIVVAVAYWRIRRRRLHRHHCHRRDSALLCHGVVIVTAMVCACVSGGLHDLVQSTDPIIDVVAENGGAAMVIGTVSVPMTVSALRDADCQTDIRVHGVSVDRIRSPSSITIRVYATGQSCVFRQGADYRVVGTLQRPRFGGAPAWLIVDDASDAVTEVREPAWWRRAGTIMQESFIRVTRRLPDHGQVLVPGLTLGVLGQDVVMTPWSAPAQTDDTTADVDEAYAQRLEDDFKQAGIMHLMAVSGSHFVLASTVTRRLCARFLIPRWATSVGVVVAYMMLATLVYPSDSVLRAAIMGLGGAACLLAGRRTQALSGLNWTVILALLIDPSLAHSYGFALSCTAVYGLVLCGDAVTRFLRGFLPRILADTMAVTIAAQTFALPVQIMMTPQLPALSVPANMLVAPFVAFTTIAGLLALCVSWAVPALGFAFAWIACLGTLPLERCATLIGGSRFSVLPWHEGAKGAMAVAAFELAVPLTIMMVRAMVRVIARGALPWRGPEQDRVAYGGDDDGTPYRARYMERVGAWWRETRTMLFERDVGDVQH
ncbi:ComEC/Rec2 family competence protein [Bifidobacterium callimiconis]|nr:ComEC/Rec2 family competence protein [Bifidobacterium callimiconis]